MVFSFCERRWIKHKHVLFETITRSLLYSCYHLSILALDNEVIRFVQLQYILPIKLIVTNWYCFYHFTYRFKYNTFPYCNTICHISFEPFKLLIPLKIIFLYHFTAVIIIINKNSIDKKNFLISNRRS